MLHGTLQFQEKIEDAASPLIFVIRLTEKIYDIQTITH